jgi:hypothetical protein
MVPILHKSMTLRDRFTPACRAMCVGILTLALSGCIGTDMDMALGVDHTVTGSINRPAGPIPGSDDAALIAAVADIDLARTPDGPFAWANPSTGTTGVIDATCRRFSTTRRDVFGRRQFQGLGCSNDGERWQIVNLSPGT